MSLLTVDNLTVLNRNGSPLVNDVSFSLEAGRWLAVIGESGSGKSLTAFSITGIAPKELGVQAERILFQDADLTRLKPEQIRRLRGKEIAYVFQDYQTSFTPYRRLGKQIDEVMRAHTDWNAAVRRTKALSMLNEVGLDGEKVYASYSFQLSGGQLQRTALALAMALEPKLLIADEPTTALDALSARTVLELLAKMKREKNCAVLFISHDLRCVRRYADHIAIMREGRIIEQGESTAILTAPRHRYTRNLLASIPPLHNPPARLPVFDSSRRESV